MGHHGQGVEGDTAVVGGVGIDQTPVELHSSGGVNNKFTNPKVHKG